MVHSLAWTPPLCDIQHCCLSVPSRTFQISNAMEIRLCLSLSVKGSPFNTGDRSIVCLLETSPPLHTTGEIIALWQRAFHIALFQTSRCIAVIAMLSQCINYTVSSALRWHKTSHQTSIKSFWSYLFNSYFSRVVIRECCCGIFSFICIGSDKPFESAQPKQLRMYLSWSFTFTR